MTALTPGAIRELTGLDLQPAASILMPTHPPDGKIPQDPIRLKTLVRDARQQLERRGLEHGTADDIVDPLLALLDDRAFWRRPAEGLAFFAGPNFLRSYEVAWPLREAAVVGPRFWVKPVLPALIATEPYYVLGLSQHQVRLLAATADGVAEVDLGDLPRSIDEALNTEPPGQNLQRHVVTGTGGERGTAVHGHLPGLEGRKEACRQFFHQVDRTVTRRMPEPRTPLVVAAVDYMLAIYREVNTHPGLLHDGLPGSPEGAASEALAARARELVRPHLEGARQAASARYEAAGPGLTSTDLATVLTATRQGRVADLFVASDVEVWGQFEPETSTLRRSDGPGPGTEDLLNLAAVHALERGGRGPRRLSCRGTRRYRPRRGLPVLSARPVRPV